MNQLNIFGEPAIAQSWELYIDGASRNNPGHASVGIYLRKGTEVTIKQGYYLGIKTNNQAEYMALIVGLQLAKEYMAPNDMLHIKSDSLLLVRQIAGAYKVKNEDLKKYHHQAHKLLNHMNYTISHVYREENKVADEQANIALDKKISLPEKYTL